MAVRAFSPRLVATWKFVDRWTTRVGKSCCAGRSWVRLDRTMSRYEEADRCADATKGVPRDP
jgi:hypothetical protein